MYKLLLVIVGVVITIVVGFYLLNNYIYNEKQGPTQEDSKTMATEDLTISPVSHASFVLSLNGQTIYNDPVGGSELYSKYPSPNIILVSDIHGDHLDSETLQAISTGGTTLIVPQAVADELGQNIPGEMIVLPNGGIADVNGISIEAIAAYNMPESEDAYHTKGRGNGYVLNADGQRVYIAGDTGDTPEMRGLEDIDIAFVPMNLPYTMDVNVAADAVVEFAPKVVHPYHYRGPDGLSDVNKFKELVETGNPNVKVELLNFYPGQ